MQQRQRRPGQLYSRRLEQCPASAAVNRRSLARISVSSPSSRNRCSPSRTSCRVASTNRSPGGARISNSSSCRRAWSEPSSCRSSSTSHSRSSSGARSVSSHSTIAHPSRSGIAVTARTSADPGTVWRSAPSTESQNLCASRSSRPTSTHAARSPRPASPIQDRSSTVLPLPGGAETTVTRAGPSSRSHSPGRDTTPSVPGRATPRATDSELSAGRIAHSRTNLSTCVLSAHVAPALTSALALGRRLLPGGRDAGRFTPAPASAQAPARRQRKPAQCDIEPHITGTLPQRAA